MGGGGGGGGGGMVEQRGASGAELAIREVNAGFMALGARRLSSWLGRISDKNAQKEYYLTDVVGLAVAENVPVTAVKSEDHAEGARGKSQKELPAPGRAAQKPEAQRPM